MSTSEPARHTIGHDRPRARTSAPWATTARIAAQLRADPRTVALISLVPPFLLTLLYFVFVDVPTLPGQDPPFTRFGPTLLAVLPMFMMFIVTSVAMLRERTSGTLERLLTTPLSRWNLIASYGLVFGLLGALQAGVLTTVLLGPMGVDIEGPFGMMLLIAFLDAVVGVSFGLLASAFARTEFQAVQFTPLLMGPQIFLCGMLVPKELMPDVLGAISEWLPMSWGVQAIVDTANNPAPAAETWQHVGFLIAFCVVVLLVAALSMPRKTR